MLDMGDVYKIFFLDGSDILVQDPDIDEELRVVRVVNGNSGDEEYYDYYPFEFIKKIIFIKNES